MTFTAGRLLEEESYIQESLINHFLKKNQQNYEKTSDGRTGILFAEEFVARFVECF